MRLQDPALKRRGPRSVWPTLNQIQKRLGLSDSRMAELLLLSDKTFLSMRGRNKDISVRAAFHLSDVLNVSFESLVDGDIDYVTMAQQFWGNEQYIPEKYLKGANSKRRTAINLLNYIEDHLGWEQRWRILQRFQMSEAMFKEPDEPINLRFSLDICDWLLKYHRTPEVLFRMGQYSLRTNKDSVMGKELRKARNLREVYELMFSGVAEKYVEKNFIWKVESFLSSECLISGAPTPEAMELIGKGYVCAPSGMWIREGFISAIPGYIGYDSASVERLSCVSNGDPQVKFRVDFSSLIAKKKRRLKLI